LSQKHFYDKNDLFLSQKMSQTMAISYQKTIDRQLEAIKEAMQQFPNGASSEEIKAAAGLNIELRTVQRRLGKLIERGELRLSGTKRTAKYYQIQSEKAPVLAQVETPKSSFGEIILSSESREILNALSVPFDKRAPIGFNRKFVDNYRPNIDFYLTAAEREQLAKDTSTTADPNQPAGTYARHILQRLLIDLSWNSSRLEGNTYSLLDTERLLAEGSPAPKKTAMETQMILNHKEAIEFIVRDGDEIGFNRYTLLNLHALLANNLLPDPAAPGRLRTYGVGISNSAYRPIITPQLIEEMFETILTKASAIINPHEQALFAMVQLPYLQPFEDVNKRVSRLAANIPLNRHNLVPISFIGVPEDLYIKGLLGVYELNRTELLKDIFLQACRSSADRYAVVRQTIGEPNPFRIKYRQVLQEVISQIITGAMDQPEASITIKARALRLPGMDHDRFIELVETELLSLHEGNFARYKITPGEFTRWKQAWNK
jgi:Fic family protein